MEWKTNAKYKDYLVSENGDILSFRKSKNGHKMKPRKTRHGYMQLNLIIENKRRTVMIHRIVADIFIGESNMPVNHMDLNKENNNYKNLEYSTPRDNTIHYYSSGISKKRPTRRIIIERLILKNVKLKDICECFNLEMHKVVYIKRGLGKTKPLQ